MTRGRGGEQSAIGGDLSQRLASAQSEPVDARVRSIENAKTHLPPRDLQVRLDRAIHEQRVADHSGGDGGIGQRIIQRTVSVEKPILDHERDVILALRQRQRFCQIVVIR